LRLTKENTGWELQLWSGISGTSNAPLSGSWYRSADNCSIVWGTTTLEEDRLLVLAAGLVDNVE